MTDQRASMPISISGLAWPADQDEDAVELARAQGFTGIEVVPTKVFSGMDALTDVTAYRERLDELGLAIPAFQAITYGAENCGLFGTEEQRSNLLRHLVKISRLAGAAGAGVCVFGAPSLRDPGELSPEAAFDLAVSFFTELAPAFESENCVLSIEPNPRQYECKFVVNTIEAIELVRAIDRPGVGLQLDTGAMTMNAETESVISAAAQYVRHFHASEPNLLPLGSSNIDHELYGKHLREAGYTGWRSAEMLATDDWRDKMLLAAEIMKHCYS
jgi:sugar phosphate isomerase/epimerase